MLLCFVLSASQIEYMLCLLCSNPFAQGVDISITFFQLSEKIRKDTLKDPTFYFIQAGLLSYKKQLEQSDSGVTPLYRPWEWNREERDKKKLLAKSSWYRPSDF